MTDRLPPGIELLTNENVKVGDKVSILNTVNLMDSGDSYTGVVTGHSWSGGVYIAWKGKTDWRSYTYSYLLPIHFGETKVVVKEIQDDHTI